MSQWVARIGDTLYHAVRMDNHGDNAPWQHGWGDVMAQVGNAPAPIRANWLRSRYSRQLAHRNLHEHRQALSYPSEAGWELAEFLGRCICAIRDPSGGDRIHGLRAGNR